LHLHISYGIPFELSPSEAAILTLLEHARFDLFTSRRKKGVSGRPQAVDAYTMMVILLYARAEGRYSCRGIARLCTRDLFLQAVLDGRKAPGHITINRFIKENPAAIEDMLFQMAERLSGLGELGKDVVFQDGTKIESRAGKYTFVWKGSVEKNLAKLKVRALRQIKEIGDRFAWDTACDGEGDLHAALMSLKRNLERSGKPVCADAPGSGHRLCPEQKAYRDVVDSLSRLDKYSHYLEMIGKDRKSMSRTDPEATFMRMKEDAMNNGQLKPAYNIQTLVDGNYIVGAFSSADRTDYHTMVPALEKLGSSLSWKYPAYCADSGYDSLANRLALDKLGIKDYIKPQNYAVSKTRAYAQEIGRVENLAYDEKSDTYTCANGKKLFFVTMKHAGGQDGSQAATKVYACRRGCKSCPVRGECMKKSKLPYKRLETNFLLVKYRKAALENITSAFGTEVRMNRSIQAEGAFAQLKANWRFRRFLSFGKKRAFSEWLLMSMAINVIHLANRMEEGLVSTPFWYSLPRGETGGAV
jgi:transposase